MKNTKKVVVGSLATIAVSCALIGGATLAYFTDEASTNIAITAGNVEISASVKEESIKTYSLGVEQDYLTFENGGAVAYEGGELVIDRITPGDKVAFDIEVANSSDIDIKYQTKLSSDNAKLMEGLKVTIDEEQLTADGMVVVSSWKEVAAYDSIADIHVEIELPKEAGNEYKTEKCALTVAVGAIQANGEAVSDSDSLKDAIAKGDELISLTCDIDVTGAGDSARPSDGLQIAPNSNLTIDGNGHVIVLNHTAFNSWNGTEGVLSGTLTFKNIHFKAATTGNGYALTLGFDSTATVIFENCTFEDMYTAIYCNQNDNGGAHVEIKDCKYINTKWGYSVYDPNNANRVDVIFENNEGITGSEKEVF